MKIFIEFILCIAIADFLSGFFHWLEDSYGGEDCLITGTLVTKPNILHHSNPRHFIHVSWFMRSRVLLLMGAIVLAIFCFLGFLNWQTILIILIGINANEIHRWAHQTRLEHGSTISFLQKLGIIQSSSHHAFHHLGDKNTHYCVITNFLNPILDAFGFWIGLEVIIAKLFGIQTRLNLTKVIAGGQKQ